MSTWKVPVPIWKTPPEDAVEFREALSRYLGDFLEKRMRQEPPFECLPEHLQHHQKLQKALSKYKDHFDLAKITEIQTAQLWLLKYGAIRMLLGDKYRKHFMRYWEVCDDFFKWARTQESFTLWVLEDPEKLNVNLIAKNELRNKLQGFEFSRQYSKYGMVVFTKKVIHDYEVVLTLDKGKMQTFFNVYIGLIRPYCGIPLDRLGFGSESCDFIKK
jgi:hypothetical protein